MVGVAFVALLLSLATFFVIGSLGSNRLKTREHVFSTALLLDKSQVTRTTLAANVAMAGGIEWFLTRGGSTNLWILIWGPAMILAGLYINAIFIKKYAPQEVFDEYSSFTSLVRLLFENRIISLIIITVTSLGSLTILVVEMHVGLQFFAVFFPNAITNNLWVLFGLLLVVTLYAVIGGLSGIVRNDWLQNLLVLSIIVVVVLLALNIPAGKILADENLPFSTLKLETTPTTLIFWLIVVNFAFIPTQLRFWQVAGSSKDRENFVEGIQGAAFQTALFWAIIAVAGYLLSVYTNAEYSSLFEMMNAIRATEGDSILSVAFVVFALAGFASLVSTADSSIISLSQMVSDNLPIKHKTATAARIIIFLLGVVVFSLYAAIFNIFGETFISVFTSAFSLFILVAPILAFGMIDRVVAKNRAFQTWSMIGLLLALVLVLSSTYAELEILPDSLSAGSYGLLIALAGCLIGFGVARRRTNNANG